MAIVESELGQKLLIWIFHSEDYSWAKGDSNPAFALF